MIFADEDRYGRTPRASLRWFCGRFPCERRGETCVTISGDNTAEERLTAVDRFQTDHSCLVAVCNLIAGGVGLTLTAGTHVIFQELDWVPANHRHAEDRAYRLGQTERVTVEYMLADGTLDGFIAELLEAKLRLIGAVEGDVPPDTSVLDDLYAKLRSLGPALMLENKLAQTTGQVRERLEALAKANTESGSEAAKQLLDTGVREFPSSRDPSQM